MLTNILKNCTIFVDGFGKAGDVETITLPVPSLTIEDFRNGGMDMPVGVPLGMEKLEMSFVMSALDPQLLNLFGVSPGDRKAFTVRGALVDELSGEHRAALGRVRGIIKTTDAGEWGAGEKASLTVSVDSIIYYKLEVGDDVVHEIDIETFTRIINGVDQLKLQRDALGF